MIPDLETRAEQENGKPGVKGWKEAFSQWRLHEPNQALCAAV